VYGGADVASPDSASERGRGAIFRIPVPPQSGPIP